MGFRAGLGWLAKRKALFLRREQLYELPQLIEHHPPYAGGGPRGGRGTSVGGDQRHLGPRSSHLQSCPVRSPSYGKHRPGGRNFRDSKDAQRASGPFTPASTNRDRSEEAALVGILVGKVKAGDVVVICYEGPRGGPGMQEMLAPTPSLAGRGLADSVALIMDGRFSGAIRLTLLVDETILQRRRMEWTPRVKQLPRGYLARYARMVSSADQGAVP